MKIYFPIAKIDAERREVWGYASTEARDDQGEVVKRDALTVALGEYMKFANIREMHQLSAVGVAKEAAVDDKGLYVGAKIVDDQAWQKVVEGVYKGYSIGGRVTQRDPADYKIITGLVLNEISLVDRPANPEAIFDYWKAGGTPPEDRFNPPFQIWACGVVEHCHLAKSDAVRCQENMASSAIDSISLARSMSSAAEGSLELDETAADAKFPYGDVVYADPGYQADGKKRYPIDSERHIRAAWNFINRPSNARRYTSTQIENIKSRIVHAWKDKIDRDGPPSAKEAKKGGPHSIRCALTKALWDVGHIARIILDLNWLQESLAIEAAMEDDNSPQPLKLQAIIVELCSFLNALVAEETGEILNDSDISGEPMDARAIEIVMMAAGASGAALIANVCRRGDPKLKKWTGAILSRASHSCGDQGLLDLAYLAVNKCVGMDGLLFAERSHIVKARDALKEAGATESKETTVGTEHNLEVRTATARSPILEFCPSENSFIDGSQRRLFDPDPSVLEMVAAALSKRGAAHQPLLDIAHDCIGKVTDGVCCVASKTGARHSQETLGHLTRAHDHLVAAGAKCDANASGPENEREGSEFDPTQDATGKLTKILAGERAEKAALIASLADIVPRLDQLTKRVEDIARTPLPPLAIAKNVIGISKQEDARGSTPSAEELAAAFSQMSKEDQTLTLIKASYARPIHPPNLAAGKDLRGK